MGLVMVMVLRAGDGERRYRGTMGGISVKQMWLVHTELMYGDGDGLRILEVSCMLVGETQA